MAHIRGTAHRNNPLGRTETIRGCETPPIEDSETENLVVRGANVDDIVHSGITSDVKQGLPRPTASA